MATALTTFSTGRIDGAVFGPNARFLVTLVHAGSGSGSGSVTVWEMETGAARSRFAIGACDFNLQHPMALSPDGEVLAFGGDDDEVALFRVADGAKLTTLHAPSPSAVAFRSGDDLIATGGSEVTVWRSNGDRVHTIPFAADAMAFDPIHPHLVIGAYDRIAAISLVDARVVFSIRKESDLRVGWGDVEAIAFRSDGASFATGSCDNVARVWNSSDGTLVHELRHDRDVNAVAFVGERWLVTHDRRLAMWDLSTQSMTHVIDRGGVALAAQGDMIATIDAGGTVLVFDPLLDLFC